MEKKNHKTKKNLPKKPIIIILSAILLAALVVSLAVFLPRGVTPDVLTPPFVCTREDGTSLSGSPCAIASAGDGTYYVTDPELHVIWHAGRDFSEIAAGKVVTADAAGVLPGGYADGNAAEARFSGPSAILAYRGGYLISDTQNHVLRFFDPASATVITFAGTGEIGKTDGKLEEATFSSPGGMCLDDAGNLYVADATAHAIRKIDETGYVSTFLGGERGFADGSFEVARLDSPSDIAFSDGKFYIADTANGAIRFVSDGELKTLAGDGSRRFLTGACERASFSAPVSLAVREKALYVADAAAGALCRIENETVTALLQPSEDTGAYGSVRALVPEKDGLVFSDPQSGILFAVRV